MDSKRSPNRFCCWFDESGPEEILGEDAKTIKELFPAIVDDLTYNGDMERSLCPAFMKSGSASLSFNQGELILKHPIMSSMEHHREESERENLAEELAINKEKQATEINIDQDYDKPKSENDNSGANNVRHNRKFTREEDEKLKNLVKQYGEGSWLRIAEHMEGRNRKQVRERYINFLKKERVVSEFTVEEDALIVQCVHKQGRKWSSIAEKLIGRTPIMVKNRYYTKLRKTMKAEDKRRSKNGISSLSTSQADSFNGEVSSPDTQSTKGEVKIRKESFKLEEDGLEKLKQQEKNMKEALVVLRDRIAKLKTNKS